MTNTKPAHPNLVATLGPASLGFAADLAAAGADTFRLNGSHMSAHQLAQALDLLADKVPDTPVVVDLQGAKMRLGTFPPLDFKQGQAVDLAVDGDGRDAIPLPHPEIFSAVAAGDTLSCDDDRVHLRIERVEGERLRASALSDCVLRPRKGVNVLEHPVHLQDLTAADIAQLEVAESRASVSFACSFMRDGSEAQWIRSHVPGARVIGKVERAEAVAAVDVIARRVDAVWICRGDLGAQLGMQGLARFVATYDAGASAVPAFIAGQVLEHLTHHATPTRSEVCHLHDLLGRGYAGIVLSDETAIGDDPVRATATARDLLDTLG